MNKALLLMAALGTTASLASADELFNTGTPEGGFLGFYGFDVYVEQSVGIAFSLDQDYTLDQVGLWMMSNDFENAGAELTVSIRTDAGAGMTIPGDTILESWTFGTSAVGWNPVLDMLDSTLHPLLTAGTTYWIVAESDSAPFVDPVWVAAAQSEPVWNSIQNSANPNGEWISGYGQGVPGLVVNGTLVPAPASAAMLGLAGLVGTRRRRA